MTSTDGYVTCSLGHAHWGLVGAAGLLVRRVAAGEPTLHLLQHRSPHVHHGDTWSTPGGALHRGESPVAGALRETREELGWLPDGLEPTVAHVTDHGGWSYTTVVADVADVFAVETDGGWETGADGFGWFTAEQVAGLPLHGGFAASWPELRDLS